jgi:putative colanic acid biosynthesis acetyltransferase WcaF
MTADPFLLPAFSLQSRIGRSLWGIVAGTVFRWSPRPFHGFRAFLLRLFGATIARDCHIYPSAMIWAPWNLVCEDAVAIADGAVIYNAALVILRSHAIVSQSAYLCGATHDYDSPSFPLIAKSIDVGPYAWVCARAVVQAGVTVGEGSVLGLGGVATKDLEPWFVYGGIPARKIKPRRRFRFAPSDGAAVVEAL